MEEISHGTSEEFTQATKQVALTRQKNRCASCGETIISLGQSGQKSHKYGEGAHAHHLRHIQQDGTKTSSNCVILCESCHYYVHKGGNYRSKAVIASVSDYPFYNG